MPPPGIGNTSTEDESNPAPPSGSAPTGSKPGQGWTPEQWKAFLENAGPIGKYIVDALKWKYEKDLAQADKLDKRGVWVLALLMGFLGGIVLLMAWLTATGKVSGDALLFLVGAVASWILFATQRYLFSSEDGAEQRPLL